MPRRCQRLRTCQHTHIDAAIKMLMLSPIDARLLAAAVLTAAHRLLVSPTVIIVVAMSLKMPL